jgi:hypothetical protein
MPVSSDPEAGRKLREAVVEAAEREVGSRRLSALDAVLYCFVPDDEAVEQVRSFLVDLVFRFLFAAAAMRFQQAEGDPDVFDQLVDQFLTRYTRLTEQNLANFRRVLKQAILTANAPRPKSERRDRLLDKQARYNCYLCGGPIEEGEDQLDHRWPRSAGGGTGKSNLFRAHAACQLLKHDLAVPGDAPVGRFAFGGNLPRFLRDQAGPLWTAPVADETAFVALMDDLRSAALRVALILRQEGKCFLCQGEFDIADPDAVREYCKSVMSTVLPDFWLLPWNKKELDTSTGRGLIKQSLAALRTAVSSRHEEPLSKVPLLQNNEVGE